MKGAAGRSLSYPLWAGSGPCQLSSRREADWESPSLGHPWLGLYPLPPPLVLPFRTAVRSESLQFRKSFHSLGSWCEEWGLELGPGISSSTTSDEQELQASHFAQG